ncbi:MAG: hypothetical protein ACJAZF_004241, partial [Granulosicoccus sp.]
FSVAAADLQADYYQPLVFLVDYYERVVSHVLFAQPNTVQVY